MSPAYASGRPRVGISMCLLGERVRYDGGHKADERATGVLSEIFEWAPVCPEVDVGMGTPREPVRLELRGAQVRLVGVESGRDWSASMAAYAERQVAELAALPIHGFLLKADSPSCGFDGVRLHEEAGAARPDGVGAFAAVLRAVLPELPIEDESHLADPARLQRFIERVRSYKRRCDSQGAGTPPAGRT